MGAVRELPVIPEGGQGQGLAPRGSARRLSRPLKPRIWGRGASSTLSFFLNLVSFSLIPNPEQPTPFRQAVNQNLWDALLHRSRWRMAHGSARLFRVSGISRRRSGMLHPLRAFSKWRNTFGTTMFRFCSEPDWSSFLEEKGASPGGSLHDELRFLVEAGFTPLEVLRAATLSPALFLGLSDSLGAVEAGKIANLVLLEANPLQDIHNTNRIVAAISEGRLLDRKTLDSMRAATATNVLTQSSH